MRLAEAYRSAGHHGLALDVLEDGLERGPSHPAGHLVMARVHHDLGNAGRERAALERALEIDSDHEIARKALDRVTGAGPSAADSGQGAPEGDEGGDVGGGTRPASHSREERAELLAELDEVAREDWWQDADGDAAGGPPDEEDDGEVVTETMARLYAHQDQWGEAEAVYRRLLARHPGDRRLERCLERVLEREVPDAPPGGNPASERGVPEGRGSGTGSPKAGTESQPLGSIGMGEHLRALLRGGGSRRVRHRPEEERRGPGSGGEGPEKELEELLRRWRRAARKRREE